MVVKDFFESIKHAMEYARDQLIVVCETNLHLSGLMAVFKLSRMAQERLIQDICIPKR